MAQPSPEEEKIIVTQEANELLLKLTKSYSFLQRLNKDIESRPFSTRVHGQFDHELKKSQNIISKLSSLLRRYHSFEFSSSLSLQIDSDDTDTNKPIDQSFLIEFKDICLKIEREWRIGSRLINEFQSKYGKNINNIDDHYHSDTDARYQHRKKFKDKAKNKSHSRSRSGSIGSSSKSKNRIRSNSNSPIHTFSNPNSPLFTHRNNNPMSQSAILSPNKTRNHGMSSLNIGLSQSQMLQQRHKYTKDSNYHSKIGQEFVPYDEEEELNKQIRDINDDLQYLLDINKQIHSLVDDQGKNVDEMKRNVSSAQDNIQKGHDTLTSIRKSPWTYGIVGGLGFAALGGAGPVILVGAGMKAAIGGALGLGSVGAYTGSRIAKKQNEKMDDDNQRDKEIRLLHDEIERKEQENDKNEDNNHNQTEPKKRNNRGWLGWYGNNEGDDDDEEDIDEWDARN